MTIRTPSANNVLALIRGCGRFPADERVGPNVKVFAGDSTSSERGNPTLPPRSFSFQDLRFIGRQRPITDAIAETRVVKCKPREIVDADFARDLERKLHIAREALEWANTELGKCTKPNPITKALAESKP